MKACVDAGSRPPRPSRPRLVHVPGEVGVTRLTGCEVHVDSAQIQQDLDGVGPSHRIQGRSDLDKVAPDLEAIQALGGARLPQQLRPKYRFRRDHRIESDAEHKQPHLQALLGDVPARVNRLIELRGCPHGNDQSRRSGPHVTQGGVKASEGANGLQRGMTGDPLATNCSGGPRRLVS
jgi:hypothetical protein